MRTRTVQLLPQRPPRGPRSDLLNITPTPADFSSLKRVMNEDDRRIMIRGRHLRGGRIPLRPCGSTELNRPIAPCAPGSSVAGVTQLVSRGRLTPGPGLPTVRSCG